MGNILRTLFASAAGLLFLTGCSMGPQIFQRSHLAYNSSVKAASDEELLLNIVRLRYLDTIEFLATSSISAQTATTVSMGARLGQDRGASTHLAIPELEFSDRPTFTFTPQRGLEFAQRLTRPVDIDTFAYLAASDWPIDLLLLLLGSEINGILNEPGVSVKEFKTAARKLGALQRQGDLLVGFVNRTQYLSGPVDGDAVSGRDVIEAARSGYQFQATGNRMRLTQTIPQPVMWLRRTGASTQECRTLLRLSKDSRSPYDIEGGAGLYRRETDYRSVVLRTRSILGAIIYLSQAVHPPESHIESGIAAREWPLPGGIPELGRLFSLRSSSAKPQASLAVKYRDYWFYIDETDMATKTTFLVLAEVYRLALSDAVPAQVPVLTLPVGG